MGRPFRILTVCVGNVCRSPVAERLLRLRLDGVAPGRAVVESAGVGAMVGHPIDEYAAAELATLGGDPADFAARRLTASLMADADVVLTASRDVRTRALREEPAALGRTFTLVEFAEICDRAEPEGIDSPLELVRYAARHRGLAADTDLDIVDPIGRPADVHREAASAINRAVDAIVTRLAPLL